jgi:hypothetical protein
VPAVFGVEWQTGLCRHGIGLSKLDEELDVPRDIHGDGVLL